MTVVAGTAARPVSPRRLVAPVWAGIVVAWAVVLAARGWGGAGSLHHESLLDQEVPLGLAVLLFVLAWQLMVAAMMLPSSLPLIRLFTVAASRQDRPRAATAAFLAAYAWVWTLFGAAAFVAALALHDLHHRTPVLHDRPWLVAGGALALAGVFQFTDLKDRCLHQCRHPAVYLMRNYRRGVGEAFRLGLDHGVFCLGCCWALMLLMFFVGVTNLVWMAVLSGVMVYEKVGRHGRRLTPVVGVLLVVWAALVLAHPAWLPEGLAGSA